MLSVISYMQDNEVKSPSYLNSGYVSGGSMKNKKVQPHSGRAKESSLKNSQTILKQVN